MARRTTWLLALSAVAALAACDATDNEIRPTESSNAASPDHGRVARVGCSAAIVDRVDPEWRQRSVVRGSFGLYGDGADIRTAAAWGGSAFWTKVPVILDGGATATLSVARRDRDRVGFTYGPNASSPGSSRDGAQGLLEAPRRVEFVPCADRAPTAWPGGLVLADRGPVHLRVRVDGLGRRDLVLGR